VLFAAALLFAVISSVLTARRSELEKQIQASLNALKLEQAGQVAALEAQHEPEILMEKRTLAFLFDIQCRPGRVIRNCEERPSNLVGLLPVPSQNASPQAVQLAKQQSERITNLAQEVDTASRDRESLEKIGGVLDKDWARLIVSAIVLLAALFVILSKRYQEESEKWAFGAIGTILGFWLG
jgi:hypothetical protein